MATDQLDGMLGPLDPTDSVLDFDTEIDETGRILDLLFDEFLRLADQCTQMAGAITSAPGDGPRCTAVGLVLRECCQALIAENAADPEMLRGLALALGDFGPQEMEAFIRSLPGAVGPLRRRRRSP